MARYQIIFSYDGTDFTGSQRQARARTVQGELERALRRVGWKGRSILLAGRTDTGVHAAGQVAAADLDWAHGADDLLKALNANLPEDLAVRSVRAVSPGFHPRFDALSRRYQYRIYVQPLRDPLRDRYAWRIWPGPEAALLTAASAALIGTHDFAAFGSAPRAGASTVRTVAHAAWNCRADEWLFEIQADAFLYRMVRRVVYTLTAAGAGRIPVEAIGQALAGGARLPAGLAPAAGLSLVEVAYPPSDDLK